MKKILAVMAAVLLMGVGAWAANEITVMGLLKAVKGSRQVQRSPGTINIDWSGSRWQSQVYSLTTNSWTPMAIGSVVTNGIVWFQNVGTSGSVRVSFNSGTTVHLVLKVSEFYSFRLDPTFAATNISFIAVQPGTNVITEDFEATILED